MGAMNVGQASPYVEAFAIARAAAAAIFAIIDREPEIDSYSDKGEKPINGEHSKLDKDHETKAQISKGKKDFDPKCSATIGTEGALGGSGWVNSGNIVFKDVFFEYPSRPDVPVSFS